MRRLTALLLVALLAGLLPTAQGEGDGVLRWSGEVVLREPFVVPAGVTLVVESGTLVQSEALHRPDGTHLVDLNRGYLKVHGRLLVEGTPESPVVLRTNVSLLGEGVEGSLLRHTRFEAADFGSSCALESWNADYVVENSTFENSSWAACIHGGSPAFMGNTFRFNAFPDPQVVSSSCRTPDGEPCPTPDQGVRGQPGAYGACWSTWQNEILCRGTGGTAGALVLAGGHTRVEGNLFESNFAGVYVYPDAGATLRGNRFLDHEAAGLVIHQVGGSHGPMGSGERRVLVEGNDFVGNVLHRPTKVVVPHGPTGLEIGGRLGGASAPLVHGERIEVLNNSFRENHVGIQLWEDARGVAFRGNVLAGNTIGLSNYYGQAIFESCRFENEVYDLLLEGGWGRVELVNSTFDPGKVKVEGDAVVAYEGGVIRAATLAAVVAGSVALFLGALTEAGRWVVGKAVLAAGYSRVARADLLRQDARARLLDRIQGEPGIHLRALAREVGSYGAAVYHLARLEKEGFVRSGRDGLLRRFYPAGVPGVDSPLPPLQRALLDLVARGGPVGVSEAARALGCSRQLASHHVRALVARGLLAVEDGPGGRRRLVTPAGADGARPPPPP